MQCKSLFIRMRSFVLLACIGVAFCTPDLTPPRPSIHVPAAEHNQGKIINGVNANAGQFPYIVSLNYKIDGGHSCGASILTPNYVLTAAHCCAINLEEYVYTSSISLSQGGLKIDIAQKIIHPEYDPDNYWHNDICIIRLNGNIPLSADAQQVVLASDGFEVPDNSPVVIPGWGYTTASGNQVIPDRLQVVTKYNALSQSHCESLSGIQGFNGHICALGQDGQGVCQGDSGGPLTYNGVQVGITSFVFLPCAGTGRPDYFSRVANYIPWIKQTIGQDAALLKIA